MQGREKIIILYDMNSVAESETLSKSIFYDLEIKVDI